MDTSCSGQLTLGVFDTSTLSLPTGNEIQNGRESTSFVEAYNALLTTEGELKERTKRCRRLIDAAIGSGSIDAIALRGIYTEIPQLQQKYLEQAESKGCTLPAMYYFLGCYYSYSLRLDIKRATNNFLLSLAST